MAPRISLVVRGVVIIDFDCDLTFHKKSIIKSIEEFARNETIEQPFSVQDFGAEFLRFGQIVVV